MPKLRLSDTWLKAVQSPGEYSDALASYLKVRVSAKGRKTFSVVRKLNGKVVRSRIGNYPDVGLAEARRHADEIFSARTLIQEPRSIEVIALSEPNASLGVFLNNYIADMRLRELKSASQVENALVTGKYAFLPFMIARYGAMPTAGEISIRDMQAWMTQSYERAPGYALHLRGYLSTAWKWAVRNRFDYRGRARDYGIEVNIAAQLPTVPKGRPGDRVLSKAELRALWTSLNDNFPTHRVLKLMIAMGGMRVTEITLSNSDYWADGWLHLPETKNGRSHTLPITQNAENMVKTCKELSDPRSVYLFSHPREPSKPMTTAAISRAAKRVNQILAFPDWNPRDIRRTMKTHLVDAGVDERWLDIWHNHGQTAGVARKHYIRAEYEELKRDVAAKLDTFLSETLA